MRTHSRLSILAGLLLFLAASMAGHAALALTSGGQGSGNSFSCDVNTRQCTCSGIWEGADCQAMANNCNLTGPVRHWCSGVPGGVQTCTCTMLFTAPTLPRVPEAFGRRPPAVANP